MFRQKGELVGILPGGFKENGRVYWSPVGASYGAIAVNDVSYDLAQDIVDSMLEYFKNNGTEEIFLIPAPLIYNNIYNQNLEYAMLYRKFDFEYHYISHAVDLKFKEQTKFNYDKKAYKLVEKIRREGKIRVEESTDFEAFYPILEQNKAKHNCKPTHSLEDLKILHQLMPEKLKLFMVYYGDIPIAGSLLFLANDKVALCFYIMMLYEYRTYKPIFLAMDESIRWAIENGYQWFDIGVSQDTAADNPMTPAKSLIYFKERFFARGIFRATYHYSFNK